MHNCEKCQKKVKNGFKMCYACNDSKSDSESEIITPSIKPYIKDPIPRTVKNCLWINFFGTSRVGVCACCERAHHDQQLSCRSYQIRKRRWFNYIG